VEERAAPAARSSFRAHVFARIRVLRSVARDAKIALCFGVVGRRAVPAATSASSRLTRPARHISGPASIAPPQLAPKSNSLDTRPKRPSGLSASI
jgi:hypothetical protein